MHGSVPRVGPNPSNFSPLVSQVVIITVLWFFASGTDMTGSVNCMPTFKVAPVSSRMPLQAQWPRYFYGAGNQFNRD